MYPQLRILLNKDLDKKICFDFLNTKAAGVDFGSGIIQLHPKLSEVREMNESSVKDFISNYFDQFYLEHQDEQEQVRREAENTWLKKRNHFSMLATNTLRVILGRRENTKHTCLLLTAILDFLKIKHFNSIGNIHKDFQVLLYTKCYISYSLI